MEIPNKTVISLVAAFCMVPLFASAEHEAKICTMQYEPVCGARVVQCIQAPCYPIYETFGNRCERENAHAISIHDGVCTKDETGPYSTEKKRKTPIQITIGGKSLTSVSLDLSDTKVRAVSPEIAPEQKLPVSFWRSLWITIGSLFGF